MKKQTKYRKLGAREVIRATDEMNAISNSSAEDIQYIGAGWIKIPAYTTTFVGTKVSKHELFVFRRLRHAKV